MTEVNRLRLKELKRCSICQSEFNNHDDLVIHTALEHGQGFVSEVAVASNAEVVVSIPKDLVGETWRLEKVDSAEDLWDLVQVLKKRRVLKEEAEWHE